MYDTYIDYSFDVIIVDCDCNKGHQFLSKNIFCPEYIQENSYIYCILFLDNCPIYKRLNKDEFLRVVVIPENIIIIIQSPNVTCHFQTVYMGIINCFKVVHHVSILDIILIFIIEEGYETMADH